MEKTILQIESEVKRSLSGAEPGHDWWHVACVRNSAVYIAKKEGADLYVTELGALLHDISDFKFNGGDETTGGKAARELMIKYDVPENIIERVVYIVDNISFKGAGVNHQLETLEAKCVQDADRLDAIGARGVARAFSYGGAVNSEMYNPDIEPIFHKTKEEYRKGRGTTINHFYEKLLLLKDRMNTVTGKELAIERHHFMENFLSQFFKELNPD